MPAIQRDLKVIEVLYRCNNQACGAEDHGKFFENENIAAIINCWQCGAGRGVQPDIQMKNRLGMTPVMPKAAEPRQALAN